MFNYLDTIASLRVEFIKQLPGFNWFYEIATCSPKDTNCPTQRLKELQHHEDDIFNLVAHFATHFSPDMTPATIDQIVYREGIYFLSTKSNKPVHVLNPMNYFEDNMSLAEYSFWCSMMAYSNLSCAWYGEKPSNIVEYLSYRYHRSEAWMHHNKDHLNIPLIQRALD